MIEKQLFYNNTNKKIQMYYDLNYKFYNSLDDIRYKKNISIEKVRIKTHLAQLEYSFKIIKYALISFYISYISYICSIGFISIKYSNFNLLYNILFILTTLAIFCIYITKLHNKNIFYLTALEALENISNRKL
ncbi:TPA: hypothetical protein ACG3RY_003990 [Clostridioides difficile]